MAGEKLDYKLAVLMCIVLVRNYLFQDEVYSWWKMKDFWKVVMLLIRCFEPEMNEASHNKSLARVIFLSYLRQMKPFLGKQILYYGGIYEQTEFFLYILFIPVFTIIARELNREYYVRVRYLVGYIQFERKMYYAYRYIYLLNDLETLFENRFMVALGLFWVESATILSTALIEGFIWGNWTVSKAIDFVH